MAQLGFIYSTSQSAISATGNSGAQTLIAPGLQGLAIDIDLTAITGSGAQVIFSVQRQDSAGNWYSLWTGGALVAPATESISIGSGCQVAVPVPFLWRLVWTIAGTSPSVTFTASASA